MDFDQGEIWSGEFYELSLQLWPRNEDLLHAILTALWTRPDIEGRYPDRADEPDEQTSVDVLELFEGSPIAHGMARLPTGSRVPCCSYVGHSVKRPTLATLDFSVPCVALDRVLGDNWLYESSTERSIAGWLADIAATLDKAAPFEVGFVGRELVVAGLAEDIVEVNPQGYPELPGCSGRLHWVQLA